MFKNKCYNRNLCFLIKNDVKYVGAIAGGSPPLDMKAVQEYFGLSADNQLRGYQGRFIFGNVLFRLEKERGLLFARLRIV